MRYCSNPLQDTRNPLLEDIERKIDESARNYPDYDDSNRNQMAVLELMEQYFEEQKVWRHESQKSLRDLWIG